ncbi:MAG: ChaN family lipoprotein [Pseudomonadota bacterium]
MKKNIRISFFIGFVALVNVANSFASGIDYHLFVEVNPANNMLYGRVEITPSTTLTMNISGLEQVRVNGTKVKLKSEKASPHETQHSLQQIQLKAGLKQTIHYQKTLNSFAAYSDKDNVVLAGLWYPKIEQLANYHFTVNLPKEFIAISEADQIKTKLVEYNRIEYQFIFPHLLDNLTLAASTQYQSKYKDYQGIRIESWFKQANAHLADSYIEHAIEYLQLYQKLLGEYPYKRFAMVESPLPSGYSMPSYTLLGSQVIALPFIVKTSLGHEILHQWFGNSIFIDYQHGNWGEGLTNYLADYYYAEQQGLGKNYRKGILRQYAAYVNKNNAFAIRKFISRRNKSSSAIGYGKVAMIFHQLSQYYGREKFIIALQNFVKRNSFRKASWHDLQREFEAVGGESLYEDFNNWLTRKDIATIAINKPAELKISKGKLFLNFSLQQVLAEDTQENKPYHLHVPMVLHYPNQKAGNKKQTEILHFTQTTQDFSIELDEPPTRVFLDPQYHLIRHLDNNEKIPDMAWLMGKEKLLLLVKDSEKELYQPLIDGLRVEHIKVIKPSELNFEQIKSSSIIIAGENNFLKEMLFAKQKKVLVNNPELKQGQLESKQGVKLAVKRNPYNDNEVILLLTAKDKNQATLAANKISHYGKYSQLAFIDGVVERKQVSASEEGIKLFEQSATQAIKPAQTISLDAIVEQFKNNRILMIGEQHDLFQHHLNQLLLIKKLNQAGYKVAIGLEMFQQPYQQVLDDYLAKKLTESEFLSKSKYFEKWRYDYNLYKPIIDYAITQKLPLIALNIEVDISRKVAKNGMLALEGTEKLQLPKSMNFENSDYSSDLKSVFQAHQIMPTKSQANFNFFLQSQILWDESMAQAANDFLQNNPQHVLVILAGNGHLRYRYGIPDRLQRLSGINPIVVVQDEQFDLDIADYILITTEIEGTTIPKIGVYLEPEGLDEQSEYQVIIKEVTKPSVAYSAGLKKGDIILYLAGKALQSFADLKLALLYADTNHPVAIKIKRGEETLEKFLNFNKKTQPHGIFSHENEHSK